MVAAQATPHLAQTVIDCILRVTDKPISHVVLTHCPAERVLAASAVKVPRIILSEAARNMVADPGQEDLDSAFQVCSRGMKRSLG